MGHFPPLYVAVPVTVAAIDSWVIMKLIIPLCSHLSPDVLPPWAEKQPGIPQNDPRKVSWPSGIQFSSPTNNCQTEGPRFPCPFSDLWKRHNLASRAKGMCSRPATKTSDLQEDEPAGCCAQGLIPLTHRWSSVSYADLLPGLNQIYPMETVLAPYCDSCLLSSSEVSPGHSWQDNLPNSLLVYLNILVWVLGSELLIRGTELCPIPSHTWLRW